MNKIWLHFIFFSHFYAIGNRFTFGYRMFAESDFIIMPKALKFNWRLCSSLCYYNFKPSYKLSSNVPTFKPCKSNMYWVGSMCLRRTLTVICCRSKHSNSEGVEPTKSAWEPLQLVVTVSRLCHLLPSCIRLVNSLLSFSCKLKTHNLSTIGIQSGFFSGAVWFFKRC